MFAAGGLGCTPVASARGPVFSLGNLMPLSPAPLRASWLRLKTLDKSLTARDCARASPGQDGPRKLAVMRPFAAVSNPLPRFFQEPPREPLAPLQNEKKAAKAKEQQQSEELLGAGSTGGSREDGMFRKPELGFAELEKRLSHFSLKSAHLQEVLLGFKEMLQQELGSDTGVGAAGRDLEECDRSVRGVELEEEYVAAVPGGGLWLSQAEAVVREEDVCTWLERYAQVLQAPDRVYDKFGV
ncbi:hypothetical protein KIL84_008455 [Mauremys mutica]|uniref:Zinc finger CCHC domain-containing protein n=1 Tax=Mauremys mutica TaxID=74926 RepID=A0A9D4AZ19_9SAUR|nr:hypothetical protein KIL84_008455 [Mauremys mutica]